jgi:hypothetical protein
VLLLLVQVQVQVQVVPQSTVIDRDRVGHTEVAGWIKFSCKVMTRNALPAQNLS